MITKLFTNIFITLNLPVSKLQRPHLPQHTWQK
jgi:hypothetical protein